MGFVLPFQARLVVRNSSTLVKAAESNKRIMTKKGETQSFHEQKRQKLLSCRHHVLSYFPCFGGEKVTSDTYIPSFFGEKV